MDESLMKFVVDLGSIGAICIVCYFFCNCMYKLICKFIEFITVQSDKHDEERKIYMEQLVDIFKDINRQ